MKCLCFVCLIAACAEEVDTTGFVEQVVDAGNAEVVTLPTRGNAVISVDAQGVFKETPALEVDAFTLEAGIAQPETLNALPTPNCIQRAIDNGYRSCPADDPYSVSTSCASDTCEDTARCKSTIDCLLMHYPTCDEDCLQACIGAPYNSNVRRCVHRVVTPFCGVQAWSSNKSWSCKKAL